ncbi:MAG: biosynthetic peptidoglycan transglycosylase, partial [Burkholderiaceae bacterium]
RLPCADTKGQARTMISGDGERSWVAADRLGVYLAPAVVAAEDQRFFEHAGIDESEVAGVLAELEGAPRRGASTITQQLARTLFTGSERSATRKLREVLYAVEMERTLGKARILELYLNTVDWGPGLCGARAAARAYFNKSPAQLTARESAWLAAILRNPHLAYQRRLEPGAPERERAHWVLMQMREFPRSDRARWSREPLAFVVPKARTETCRIDPTAAGCQPLAVARNLSRVK